MDRYPDKYDEYVLGVWAEEGQLEMTDGDKKILISAYLFDILYQAFMEKLRNSLGA